MRLPLAVFFLCGCATAPAVVKPAAVAAAPAATCPTGPVPYTESTSVVGAMVEKVCLVGASEDSYLRMHELVAPREGSPLDVDGVRADLEAKPKSIFSRSVLQRDMERIRARAKEKGFVVEITPLTSVDSDKKTIDVAFELEKRPNANIQF